MTRVLEVTGIFLRWQDDHVPGFVRDLSRRLALNLSVHVLDPYLEGPCTKEILDGMRIGRFE